MNLSARQRAMEAAKAAYSAKMSNDGPLIDRIEAMFRAHATAAVNLARQEWEAEQAESGFRAAALDSFLGP